MRNNEKRTGQSGAVRPESPAAALAAEPSIGASISETVKLVSGFCTPCAMGACPG